MKKSAKKKKKSSAPNRKPGASRPKPLKEKKRGSRNRPWFVYVIQAENGALYTGITTDIMRRFEEHNSKKRGARFFRMQTAVQVMWTERHSSRSSASRREAAIKQMKREEKKRLVGIQHPTT